VHSALRYGHRGALLLASLVLVGGLLLSLVASLAFADLAKRGAGQAMDRRTALAQEAVVAEVRRYEDAVRTVAAAAGAHDPLNRTTFDAVTQALAGAHLVGATDVSFVIAVSDGEVAAAQAFWQSMGATGLEFKPEGHGEHLFQVFHQPLDGRAGRLPGTDRSRVPEPSAAMAEARRSGAVAVSDTFVLERDRALPTDQQQMSFILAAPVYGPLGADGSAPFRGWITMGLHGQDFVGGTLSVVSQGLVGAALWATNASGQQVRVAALPAAEAPDLYREVTIAVAQRSWTLRTSVAARSLPGGSLIAAWAAGGSGLVFSVLLAGLIWLLASGRVRAEAQMMAATGEAREQAILLREIIEAMTDGVTVTDETGRFLIRNAAARSISGVDADTGAADGWQQHFGIYLPDGVTEFPTEQLPGVRALAGEATDHVEMLIRNAACPQGVLVKVQGRPLQGADGRRKALSISQDVTAARAQEAELVAFAGMVAHDLKSPLNAVAGYAEILAGQVAQDVVDPQTLRLAANRIHSGVRGMVMLINELLSYATARDAPLRPRPVDLTAVVTEVVAQRTDHLAGADAEKPDVYVGHLPQVVADPALVRQLLDNLIGNAFTYVEPGQRARVDISATDGRSGWVQVVVADRGLGVPDAHKPRVMEPFHRVPDDDAHPGSGLGLAICRRIVERHGGVITIADNPGGGTRLQFTLPAADDSHLPG
jgi:signal transduction histidine kinase